MNDRTSFVITSPNYFNSTRQRTKLTKMNDDFLIAEDDTEALIISEMEMISITLNSIE